MTLTSFTTNASTHTGAGRELHQQRRLPKFSRRARARQGEGQRLLFERRQFHEDELQERLL